jgi:L-Ala-D/L-Glu epimerase
VSDTAHSALGGVLANSSPELMHVVVRLTVEPLSWKLRQRTANAKHTWTDRSAWIVRLSTPHNVGFGEAAPLPGFSPPHDDLVTCQRDLLSRSELRLDPDASLESTLASATKGFRSPSAKFGLESALIDLIGKMQGKPARVLLESARPTRPTRLTLPISALLRETDPRALVEEAQCALGRGITTAKLKVGPTIPRDRLDALRSVTIMLRLDANQSLSPAEDLSKLDAAELLEEPVGGAAWLDLASPPPIPLVMDESLVQEEDESDALMLMHACVERKICSGFVLKPMALGILRTIALARFAEAHGLFVIVTHLFDGPIAAAATSEVALSLSGDVRACGLDSFGREEDWPAVCKPPSQIAAAKISCGERPGLSLEMK